MFCRQEGLKYDKAKTWSIPCINALWLRDVLQSDGITPISITDEKYLKPLDAAAGVTGFLLDISKAQHMLRTFFLYLISRSLSSSRLYYQTFLYNV